MTHLNEPGLGRRILFMGALVIAGEAIFSLAFIIAPASLASARRDEESDWWSGDEEQRW